MIGAGPLSLVVGLALLAGAVLLARFERRLAYAVLGGGAFALVGAGLAAGLTGTFAWGGWTGPLGETEFLRVDALSGYFLIVVGIVGVAVAGFAFAHDPTHGPGVPMGTAATLLGIGLVLAAPTSLLFLAGWEIMTLGSFVGLLEGASPRERLVPAAYAFLGLGEASTLAWFVAWGALRAARGTWLFAGGPVPAEWAGIVFVAGAVAATIKMGVLPFQIGEWLPLARAQAPAPVAALVSAAVTAVGAYGLLRLMTLLGPGPAWWGGLLLVVGCASALVGALWASVSDHPQGLLAYSTIENNGLILVALGASLIASAYGLTGLAAVALFAALFQVFAHASAKSGLFLVAGPLARGPRPPSSDRDRFWDGRAAGPSLGMYLAGASLAAAPPMAGFVAEWMILETLFQSYRIPSLTYQLLGLFAGALLALAAGLMVVAMTKFVGYDALRRTRARNDPGAARPRPGPILGIASVSVALGVAAPWVLTALAPVVGLVGGRPVSAPVVGLLGLPIGWSIVSGAPFGAFTPTAIPVALGLGTLVAVGYAALGRPTRIRRTPVWMSGSRPDLPGEIYGSKAFSTGLRTMLKELLPAAAVIGFDEARGPSDTGVPEALDPFERGYTALAAAVQGLGQVISRNLMVGRLDRYVAYLLIAVLAAVAYVGILYH